MNNQRKAFARSFRGYNTAEVDHFVDELTYKYNELQLENSDLEAKLKAALEQINSNIKNDEEIRATLLDAKRAAASIIADADEKSSQIMSQTRKKCDELVTDMVSRVTEQRHVFELMKEQVLNFRSELFEKYSAHISKIDSLSDVAQAYNDAINIDLSRYLSENETPFLEKASGHDEPVPASVTVKHNEPAPVSVSVKHNEPAPASVSVKHDEPAPASVSVKHNEPAPASVTIKHNEPAPASVSIKHDEPAPASVSVKHDEPAPASVSAEADDDFYKLGDTQYKSASKFSKTAEIDSFDIFINDDEDEKEDEPDSDFRRPFF